MNKTRPSALPRLMRCGQSGVDDGGVKGEWHCEPGRIGSLVHAVLAGADVDIPESDEKEVNYLVWTARNYLKRYGITGYQRELQLEFPDVVFKGTADVLHVSGDVGTVIDFKTSRLKDVDYFWQIIGYCYLASKLYPEVNVWRGIQLFQRDDTHIVGEWTPEQLEARYQQVLAKLSDPGDYVAGEHCGFCPRARRCPLLLEQLQATAQILEPWFGDKSPDFQTILEDPAQYVAMLRQIIQTATKAVDTVKALATEAPIKGLSGTVSVEVDTRDRYLITPETLKAVNTVLGERAYLAYGKALTKGGIDAALKETYPGRAMATTRKEIKEEMFEQLAATPGGCAVTQVRNLKYTITKGE